MRDSLGWLQETLDNLNEDSLRRKLRVRQSPHVAGMLQIDGRQLIDFGSNDYLGLSSHSRIVEAVRHAVCQVGWGSGASPLVNGRAVLHQKLEHAIAEFKQTEAALLFTTGFAANSGTIPAIMFEGDVILSDEKNHASIIDGCRLSRAQRVVYRHICCDDLRSKLNSIDRSRKKLIVTDSVFSMDGDIAPLVEICELADQFGAMVMVDEAHATGLFGKRGSGVCEMLGVENQVDIRVGTLSKALGSLGGFVAGSKMLIEFLFNRSRSYVFSTAQPEAISAAGIEAIHLIHDESWRRDHVLKIAAHARDELADRGWKVGSGTTPILPVFVGDSKSALDLQNHLSEAGIFAPAIRPPAVQPNQSIIRLSFSANHTDSQISSLLEAMDRPKA